VTAPSPSSSSPPRDPRNVVPGVIAATTFAFSDVFGKIVFKAGGDVLTLVGFRGALGMVFLAVWLRTGAPLVPFKPRERLIALGVGLLFAATVFSLFKAIDLMDVPTAILAYFVYPLITGIGAAMSGLERLSWRGLVAAAVAFLGLALIVGARPGELALAGVMFSFAAAITRSILLLITRAKLGHADARLTTWYSMLSSTGLFVVIALVTWNWVPPTTGAGWAAMIGTSVTTTIAILTVFISTNRVGPFRTALIMNLEPLLAAIISAIMLGDAIAPVQALGGTIMLAALVAFQLWR
jgi:drug/metabolite transporter (DMT)-like permease